MASPWVRDLRTGAARREHHAATVAQVSPFALGGFEWSGGKSKGKAPTRELAKLRADEGLRKAGYTLLAVPGGCVKGEG